MNKRGLISNSILLLIGFLLLSTILLIVLDTTTSENSITGNVIKMSCVDSDGGRNIYVYGTLTKSGTFKKDVCSGSSLKEWYCENNQYKSKMYRCINGCRNGACNR